MRKLMYLSILAIFGACSPTELTEDRAMELIKEAKIYPKAYDYQLNLADPAVAKQVLDLGLESAGLVNVRKTWTMADQAEPLITFTEKARPYLMGTPAGEDSTKMRFVRVSTREIVGITTIDKTDEKHAAVNFTVRHTNFTPFRPLIRRDLDVPEKNFVEFEAVGGSWQLKSTK